MKRSILCAAIAIALCAASAGVTHAQISTPRTISFQGVLAGDEGGFVSDGSHTLLLSIYDQLNSGGPLVSETQTVEVLGGVFNSIITIPASLPFDRAYFLGVAVDGGAELAPRTAMTTAPYAFRAIVADSVSGGAVKTVNGMQGAVSVPGEIMNSDGSISVGNGTGPSVDVGVRADGIQTHHIRDGSITTSKVLLNAITADRISTEGAASGLVLMSDGGTTPLWGPAVASDLVLPFVKSQADTGALFSITNSGAGRAAFFSADNTNSYTGALEAMTSGSGLVAKFTSTNTTAFGSSAVQISSGGTSIGLQVYGGGGGGWFLPGYPGGVYASSGSGSAIQGSSTSGAGVYGGASTGTGVYAQARGTGNALIAVSESGGTSTTTNGNIALFKNTVNAGNVARISSTGRGYFNGGTQLSGADVAEAFDVVGERSSYEPGDVLVVSTASDRTVEKSRAPNSTSVVGVYATKPGMLLSDRGIDDNHDDRVPMGVVGVIPTKVTTEGGVIHRGDLLVTSSTPGAAMRATPVTIGDVTFYPSGIIIGKALENFDGEGTGLIEVMVSVK